MAQPAKIGIFKTCLGENDHETKNPDWWGLILKHSFQFRSILSVSPPFSRRSLEVSQMLFQHCRSCSSPCCCSCWRQQILRPPSSSCSSGFPCIYRDIGRMEMFPTVMKVAHAQRYTLHKVLYCVSHGQELGMAATDYVYLYMYERSYVHIKLCELVPTITQRLLLWVSLHHLSSSARKYYRSVQFAFVQPGLHLRHWQQQAAFRQLALLWQIGRGKPYSSVGCTSKNIGESQFEKVRLRKDFKGNLFFTAVTSLNLKSMNGGRLDGDSKKFFPTRSSSDFCVVFPCRVDLACYVLSRTPRPSMKDGGRIDVNQTERGRGLQLGTHFCPDFSVITVVTFFTLKVPNIAARNAL